MLQFTRAHARSGSSIAISAVRDDAEPFQPDGRLYRYDEEYPEGKQWSYDNFHFHISDITVFSDPAINDLTVPIGYYVLLASDGRVFHAYWKENYTEEIGDPSLTLSDMPGIMLSIRQIGDSLFACGAGGLFLNRTSRGTWKLLSENILFDADSQLEDTLAGPDLDDPNFLDWAVSRAREPTFPNYFFNDMAASTEGGIYLCGEEGNRPALFYWDGATLEKLAVPIAEGALTGVHVEDVESVWVCGREGVVLHGSRHRGFAPVDMPTRLNLFHGITTYQGKLVLPASVRPGGLYQLDPRTRTFGRFDPPLPPLTTSPVLEEPKMGPFFAQSVDDVLWVVAPQDVYRFDGTNWERIAHPDVP